jgi:hypothetical protein
MFSLGENKVLLCDYCGGEIYDNDLICNLGEIYGAGAYVVHDMCVCGSLCENKDSVTECIFDDLCKLADVAACLVEKHIALEYGALGADEFEG